MYESAAAVPLAALAAARTPAAPAGGIPDAKWSRRKTFLFVVCASLGLWLILLSPLLPHA